VTDYFLKNAPEMWLMHPIEMQMCIDDCRIGYAFKFDLAGELFEFLGMDRQLFENVLALLGR
jgi:hypothetical protein